MFFFFTLNILGKGGGGQGEGKALEGREGRERWLTDIVDRRDI